MTTLKMTAALAYEEWLENNDRHGACPLGHCQIADEATCPQIWEMECYECAGFDGEHFVMRRVTRRGAVVNRADPTQTYVLACGHTVGA